MWGDEVKTLHGMINDAEIKRQFWVDTAEDPQALKDREKTKEQALNLASYFEGKYDALCEALRLST